MRDKLFEDLHKNAPQFRRVTSLTEARKEFVKTEEYQRLLKVLIAAGVMETLAESLILEAFYAGWNAKP